MPTAVGTEQLAASSSPSQESAHFTPGFGFMFKSCTEPAMENDTDGRGRDVQPRHPSDAVRKKCCLCGLSDCLEIG